MRRKILALLIGHALLIGAFAEAGTVAYWRFEDGVADTDLEHIAVDGNMWSADVLDVSGNDNHLSAWITGGCCGKIYRSEVPNSVVPATGQANTLSVQNTGGGPGMFTGATGIQTIAPAAFTIEASFKLENGGYRTVVGRDSQGAATGDGNLAAVYLQVMPDNQMAIKFTDQEGFFHEAISAPGTIDTWDTGTETSADADWYHVAAVSDGSMLSLWLANATQGTGFELVAQTDLLASGSTNTAMTPGAGDGGDWDAGNWTVSRGMYGGGHGDRAYGFIDEVRISDHALENSEFLFNTIPEPGSFVLALMGIAMGAATRRR